MEPAATFRVWAGDAAQPASSLPAQVAAKLVAEEFPNRSMPFHRRLLEAYFAENRNIADNDELLQLATEVGIDATRLREVAGERSAEMTERVIADHNGAIERGVTGVPTVLFDDTFPVPGAQDVDTYERIVERIEANRVPPGE